MGTTIVQISQPEISACLLKINRLSERTDPAALILSPPAWASKNNKIAEQRLHRRGLLHLPGRAAPRFCRDDSRNDPLGLTLAVNGDILTTNDKGVYFVERYEPLGPPALGRLVGHSLDVRRTLAPQSRRAN